MTVPSGQPLSDGVLAFVHIGDLHITDAKQRNFLDFLSIVAQIEVECAGTIDFVVLPGDNADNGLRSQYALTATALKMLSAPVHVIPGDHDMEQGGLAAFYKVLKADPLPKALTVRGFRCLFLDVSGPGRGGPDFRLGNDQVPWLERELQAAGQRGETSLIFTHSYPADLRGDGETEAFGRLIATHDVALVDMGHTHYNELANDGRTIFAATRSTGQIEEGPVGYSVVTLDNGIVSWRFKPLDDAFPFVVITAPADHRLLRDPGHVLGGSAEVRALVFGRRTVVSAACRTEEGTGPPCASRPGSESGQRLWPFPLIVWCRSLSRPSMTAAAPVSTRSGPPPKPMSRRLAYGTAATLPPSVHGPRTGSSARSSDPTARKAIVLTPDFLNGLSSHAVLSPRGLTWTIAALATAGVITRPFNLPEAVWAMSGAVLLVILELLSPGDSLSGIGKGTDVYLFLTGMMLLAETAREEKLFDWLAAVATKRADGSATKLFLLIYGVGTIVTIFLSNDATAVVLTPAVTAAVKTAKAEKPLPYLLICAFIANAASFVLPISNPANLVIYGSHMPPLLQWLPRYALPSLLSIAATYAVLRWTQRDALTQEVESDVPVPDLSGGGKTAALGIAATALVLLGSSFFDIQLGLPTAIAGAMTAFVVLIREQKAPWTMLKGISWGVLPLVAGLFVLVEALDKSGLIQTISAALKDAAQRSATGTAWGAGTLIAFASNLMNNLPAGLIAGNAVQSAYVLDQVTSAVLVGVDLGPNLSVTGSLATILWLTALRREGQNVSAWTFLKLGFLVMPPALLLALAGTFLFR